jgi:hypothetical protein
MIIFLRILNGLLAALFVYAAAVNVNDPDPVQWVALYAAAAVATAWAAWHPGGIPWWSPLIVGGVAAVWASVLGQRVAGKVRFGELWSGFVADPGMKTQLVEEGREYYGLCITAGAMLLAALTHWLGRHAATGT